MKHLILILCFATINSCTYFTGEPESHKGFENECDCYVYNYEVNSEWYGKHLIETIDDDQASECVKSQISGTHLLKYNNKYYINTGLDHPDKTIKKIDQLAHKYKSDTTHLASISIYNKKTVITTKRKATKENNEFSEGMFEWQIIYLNNKDTLTVDSLSITKYFGWLKK